MKKLSELTVLDNIRRTAASVLDRYKWSAGTTGREIRKLAEDTMRLVDRCAELESELATMRPKQLTLGEG